MQGKQNNEAPQQCPRCDSFNTKFCYYNNYSLSQPRYFCKACKRYWTKGGSLRNVPIGGGSRKPNKRAKTTGTSSSSSPSGTTSLSRPMLQPQPPPQDQHESRAPSMMTSTWLGYYGGPGYMGSSLPYAHQNLGYLGNVSNMGMLHGFNNAMSSYSQHRQMPQMQNQLYPSHYDQRALTGQSSIWSNNNNNYTTSGVGPSQVPDDHAGPTR